MADLIFILVTIVFFILCIAYTYACGKLQTMENIVVAVVAIGLIVYLFWTLIRPESF